MIQPITSSDWSRTRGEKWVAQLAGMEATLAPIDAPLLDALSIAGATRFADVACGGGGTTLALARRAGAGARVEGFDIAESLVNAARERAVAEGSAATFAVADIARSLPAAPYDRVVSRFGTMFFDDPPAAFGNLRRWLSPGGRFVFAVWAPLADNPWLGVVRDVVAGLVDMPKPVPDTPGPFRYADAGKLVALLGDAGFGAIGVHDWRGSLPIGGGLHAADATRFALASFSSFAEMLESGGPDAFERAEERLRAAYTAHAGDGPVHMDARVWLVTGTS